ncbi:MAG TPA: LysM peptidoglycan-binding domain-containing protein [bacterium]|nr:LysM peptidoglycan-binding domain-containing protein [bacterium]
MSARQNLARTVLLVMAMTLMVATRAAAADPLTHTVQKGETLYAIARRYDVAVDLLMKANAIADPSRLSVGMTLTIPGQSTVAAPTGSTTTSTTNPVIVDYVVKKGDTLYGIAKAHGVSVEAILKASSITSTTIRLGQRLKIPSTAPASTPASTFGPVAISDSVAVVPKPAAGAAVTSARLWPAKGQVAYLQGKLKGVSIVTEPSVAIQTIRSGTVISAGPFRGFGQVAFIQASDGLVYVYGGASALSVRVGDVVRVGASIGTVASEPNPSVYFFVFKGAETVDPDTVPRNR